MGGERRKEKKDNKKKKICFPKVYLCSVLLFSSVYLIYFFVVIVLLSKLVECGEGRLWFLAMEASQTKVPAYVFPDVRYSFEVERIFQETLLV